MIELPTIATLAKYLADYLKLRRDRKSTETERTLQHYLEWLRRRDQVDLALLIQGSRDLCKGVEQLIRDGQRRSEDELRCIMEGIAEQREAIEQLPVELRQILRDELAEHVEQLLDKLRESAEFSHPAAGQVDPAFTKFEADYRKVVATELDRVELFGADLSKEAQSQRLTVAYVSLNLRLAACGKRGRLRVQRDARGLPPLAADCIYAPVSDSALR